MRGATLSPPTLCGVQIDYLVNNAGRSQRASAVETSVEVDRALLELNVLGTISLTKAVLPEMLKRESGMVVVISSVAGKMGEETSLYCQLWLSLQFCTALRCSC